MAAHPSSTRLLRRFGAVLALATLSLAFSAAANAATPSTGLLKIGGPFPASVKAGNFRYVILHSDRASLIPALKAANPQLKVLVYKDMAAALSWAGNTQVPAGVSMAEAEANPDWFLKDTTGKRIEWCDFAGDWQMDVGSRSYQDRWAANVAADMRANGWDGVFVDDTNASQSWHLCGRTIAKYPTDAAYAAATRSFLANAGPALTSQGFLVIPNIYLPYSSSALSTWLDWISFTSGGMQEFWSKWGTSSTGHFGGADWTYRQQFLGATQKAGKIFLGLSYAPNADVRSMRYARSTFLLDWDGGASAVLFEGESGGDPTSVDWMTDIGTPRGARYPVGAAWRRDYTRRHRPRESFLHDRLGDPRLAARQRRGTARLVARARADERRRAEERRGHRASPASGRGRDQPQGLQDSQDRRRPLLERPERRHPGRHLPQRNQGRRGFHLLVVPGPLRPTGSRQVHVAGLPGGHAHLLEHALADVLDAPPRLATC